MKFKYILQMSGFLSFFCIAAITVYASNKKLIDTAIERQSIQHQVFFTEDDGTAKQLIADAKSIFKALSSSQPIEITTFSNDKWYLSLVPQTAGGYLPYAVSLDNGIYSACQQIWLKLSDAQKESVRQEAYRLKVDHIITSDQQISPGWKGFNFDKGLSGFALKHEKIQAFRVMPSWTIETQTRLTQVDQTIRKHAQILANWPPEKAAQAQLFTFRTTTFIDGSNDQALPVMRVNLDMPEITVKILKDRIASASQYLARETDEQGRITYEYLPQSDRVSSGFNLLRHAGTIHSMIQAWHLSHDDTLLAAIQRAKSYFLKHIKEDSIHPGEYYALEGSRAKLGGAGLGLYFLSELEEFQPNSTDAALLEGIARHLIRQQQSSGEFLSYYDWNQQGIPKEKSHYYPGEAILGLLQYHILTGNPEALAAAQKGIHYLTDQRWQAYGLRLMVSPDAWLAQAIELMDRHGFAQESNEYLFEIADLMIRQRLHMPDSPPDIAGGGLETLEMPNISSAGSKLEAIAAAALLEKRQNRGQTCMKAAQELAQFVLRSQFTPDNSWWIVNPKRALGAFRQGPDVALIRNDFVQHNMSGLYLLLQAMENK